MLAGAVDWTWLGHAMWLVEAGALRLVCDPLLAPTHHGGVFEVVPRRTVVAEALRADFVLVSHCHPDHFDVPSLHRLALLDPDSVVITPDPLVAWAAGELGFRTVRVVPPGQLVDLGDVRLVTTPSVSPSEWGAMLATDDAVVWNQVDTVPADAAGLQAWLATSLAALGEPRIDLALVRWQPMLEIAAPLGQRTSFPYRDYAAILEQAAAMDARAVVAASCSGAHTGVFAWLDRYVYPIGEDRFARDLQRRAPGTACLGARIGSTYRVRAHEVHVVRDRADALVRIDDDRDPRAWSPFAIPALVDPHVGDADEPTMRARVAVWIEHELAPALAAAWPHMQVEVPLRFAVDVVFPTARDGFTIVVDGARARVDAGLDPDWDACNVVAGSLLWEVIEGRRHWGDVLLAGALRTATRAYAIDAKGLRAARVGETFLYYALSYDDAVRRAARWDVVQALASVGRPIATEPP
jgi:hypothetical protein